MQKNKFAFVAAVLGTAFNLLGADQPSLNPHLEPLRPLLGKTWRGAFKDSKPESPVVDISRWERVLNGQGVRMIHSINAGMYGGETIFRWDEQKGAITFWYFTTATFMSTGTLEIKDGKFLTHEDIKGEAGGITEVRATCELLPDGSFHVKAEHLKAGQWGPGHEVTYRPDASGEVVFK